MISLFLLGVLLGASVVVVAVLGYVVMRETKLDTKGD